MKKKIFILGSIVLVLLVGIFFLVRILIGSSIIYGISPFQDTAIPKVAEGMNLYQANNLNVKLHSVAWEDIIPSLSSASGSIDVGIGSINLLLPKAENINVIGKGDIIFYFPFYVFKGASLMMHKDSPLKSYNEFKQIYPNDSLKALSETMKQLKGLKIGLPQGTPYEQMLISSLQTANMDYKKDIDLRYVKLSDGLPAFLNGDLDIVGAGVTQRTEAMRYGHKVLIDMESLGFAEIIGLVTTKHYADAHKKELDKLVSIWFQSIDSLMKDPDKFAKPVLEYLEKTASTKYSIEEYKTALSYQLFPQSLQEADDVFFKEKGKFYWKRTWDIVNSYLIGVGKVRKPIQYDFFWGEKIEKEVYH